MPEPEFKRRTKKGGDGLWLMSFSDMSLTLMTFFLLMVSTMKPANEKFQNMKDGMNAKVDLKKIESLQKLAHRIEKVIKEKKLEKSTEVKYDSDGIHLEFKDGLLFESGSATTNPTSQEIVGKVLGVIATMAPRYRMKIEGHTDDLAPKKNARFETNWELGAARGFSLMRQFNALGVSEKNISVVSYAHTQPKIAFVDLTGPELKKARDANRRVVIWIE
jgi:flagellar motor protein MotB